MSFWKKFWAQLRTEGNYWFLISVGLSIMMFGITFNFLAVTGNGGRMPVFGGYLDEERHFSFHADDNVKHYFLTDILHISDLYFSVGDVLILIGAGLAMTTAAVRNIRVWKGKGKL
jgi:hypothetical protein